MREEQDSGLDREIREALTHLYDHAYLETHPLAARLAPTGPGQTRTRGQETRRILLDAIELLKPGDNVSLRAPERRAYAVLFGLYIEGQETHELADVLGVGERQLRRDRATALEALASILRDRYLSDPDADHATEEESLHDESRRLAQQVQETNLHTFVEKLVPLLGPLAHEQGVDLHSDVGTDLPAIPLNAALMRQVLLSLASQALTELPLRKLTFLCRHTEGLLALGLELHYRQGHKAAAPTGALPFVDKQAVDTMVDALGGKLWCETVHESRQTVWVLLPQQHKMTVLLVDDRPDLFELFLRYVGGRPYQLLHASGVDRALEMVRTDRVDIVILDLMMPERDGWEFLQTLQEDPELASLPVIVCSVLHEPELAYSLGAQAYLKKPVRATELLQALENVRKQVWAGEVHPATPVHRPTPGSS